MSKHNHDHEDCSYLLGSLSEYVDGDLGEPVFATPAIAEGRLYVRTRSALYCFANEER